MFLFALQSSVLARALLVYIALVSGIVLWLSYLFGTMPGRKRSIQQMTVDEMDLIDEIVRKNGESPAHAWRLVGKVHCTR